MPPRKKPKGKTPLESYTHEDKRTNIPTEELRDFLVEEDQEAKALLYPRDPSLDPQLVWKGKDEQDQTDLAVEARPIYIQEKIHPRAIIEDIRRQAGNNGGEPQAELFADFNGLDFGDMIDFYKHEQNWANRMILGDSLQVMASLAEKEGLRGKVQMVYVDPPYGIQFGSNWQVSTRKRNVTDGRVEDATREPEQVKAFRDTWAKGIHSYLTYLRDRLVVIHDLLTETGSVFFQIGDENVHLVRCLLDEVFGRENFVAIIPFRKKTMPFGTTFIEQMGDFILWYAKHKTDAQSRRLAKYHPLFVPQNVQGEFHHCWYEMPDGHRYRMTPEQLNNHALLPKGARVYRLKSLQPSGRMESGMFDTEFEGKIYEHPKNGFGTSIGGMERLRASGRLQSEGKNLNYILYADENPASSLTAPWFDTVGADDKRYVVQTNTQVIKRCMLMTTDPGDLVLDPTCGSGTTAYVAEQWGRRWITTDTSRVALAIARTRIMTARYPHYLLSDSPDGVKKEAETSGLVPFSPVPKTEGNLRKGFVYRRAPHVTLGVIANNAEIDRIHHKWQQKLDFVREELNRLLGQSLEEWQMPYQPDESWPYEAVSLLHDWWNVRQERQKEIDASVSRNSDQKVLYDKPYEDSKRLRVAGPFTVESLSPHRVLSADDTDLAAGGGAKDEVANGQQFVITILDNLNRAGVQNTVKQERLHFDRLDPYAGVHIDAGGEYTEQDGSVKRVAVCIGPEHGTVGPDLIKDAAKEAVRGEGFDLLVVCGFAFDPHVSEEATRYGKLTVLVTRMNPDLAMGDELLKKTGAGNLFMVFGEPDIKVEPGGNGKLTVKIHGVDVYDPTTGQIRSNSTDDIACWFIDTDYNEESFFVRHAYFTGADEPYEKLKKTLQAEINEEAWSSVHSTRSRPFDPPKSGKIAVKVINHYGDEVMKVCKVASTAPVSPMTS